MWLVVGSVAACAVTDGVPVRATDVAGQVVSLRGGVGTRAVVLFFVATDCPISNRYLPEMRRLVGEFGGEGVRFWFVYPNLTETAAGIRAHAGAFGTSAEPLRDADGALARGVGARATPEAAVLVPAGDGLRTVYAGRIDDRYLSLGTERPQAGRHDLEEAVRAVVAGKAVPGPGGPVVGCGIVSGR